MVSAEDEAAAAKLALVAGVDIDMKTAVYANQLENVINGNEELQQLLDDAVYRVLKLKNDLGLFEDPIPRFKGQPSAAGNARLLRRRHKTAARSLAEQSIVLLKNEQELLPLSKQAKIALIGPYERKPPPSACGRLRGMKGIQ